MTPDFRLLANEEDITDTLRTQLISLRVTDEAGMKSDALEIQLDDAAGRIAWPRKGAELVLKLGYKESSLKTLGRYTVDEIEHSGPPQKLTIRAKAADMRQTMKAKRTRFWEDATLDDVVKTLAPEDLVPGVSEALSGIGFTYLEQKDESNLHFLTRVANDNGAVMKPTNGYLIVAPKGEAKSISGKSLVPTTITPDMIARHRFVEADRQKYESVIAYWQDAEHNEKQIVRAGEGDPTDGLIHTYPNASEAQRAAKARLKQLKRGLGKLELGLIGNIDVQADGRIIVEGLREPITGVWSVTRVEHNLSHQGFVTSCSAEIPNS